jgi:hypothetical protein
MLICPTDKNICNFNQFLPSNILQAHFELLEKKGAEETKRDIRQRDKERPQICHII